MTTQSLSELIEKLRRVYEHKNNLIKGFTAKYKVHHLVYLEEFDDVSAAITREKQLKI